MQPWLDFYVSGMGASVQLAAQMVDLSVLDSDMRPSSKSSMSDGEAFQMLTRNAVECLVYDVTAGSALELENLVWLASLAPFAGLAPGLPSPAAFLVDRNTVAAFIDADASDEVRKLGREQAFQKNLTYLDLPHRSLMLSELVQLRALFIQHASDVAYGERGKLRFIAVLTLCGSNKHRRLTWLEDSEAPMTDAFEFAGAKPLKEALKEYGPTLAEVMLDCETFALLTLAYVRTAEEGGTAATWQTIPRLPADDPRRRGRNARQSAKKFSLFRIQRMAVGGNLDRQRAAGEPSGHMLGRRSRVRGHFRLQPYGTGRQSRRLIWIAPHERGPCDAVPTTEIVRLRLPEAA